VQSTTLGLALVGAGAVRARAAFSGEPAAVAAFAVLLGLVWLQAGRRRSRRPPPRARR
jgi:hypothetical protein